MTPLRQVATIVLTLFVTGAAMQLNAQARIGTGGSGGGRGGGIGVRSGGRGGGISAAPGSIGGRAGSGRTPRGSTSRPANVGGGATLNPRGNIGGSGTANARFPQAPASPAPAASQAPAHASTPKASVGVGSVSRTFVSVPRGRPSIPPLGNSIPPLESSGQHPRPRIDAGNVRGFGFAGLDFGHRGRGRFRHPYPVVYLPYGYGYSDYSSHTERIVIVDHRTESGATTETTPPAAPPTAPPASADAKIIELRPRDPDPEQPAPDNTPQDPSSVEVLSGSESETGEVKEALYLLARKDETIVTSQRHWISGNTLHYITPKGLRRRILIENLDLDLTARLNRERGLPFTLEVLPENGTDERPGRLD